MGCEVVQALMLAVAPTGYIGIANAFGHTGLLNRMGALHTGTWSVRIFCGQR